VFFAAATQSESLLRHLAPEVAIAQGNGGHDAGRFVIAAGFLNITNI
jgi:hypothetical protein